MSAPIRGLFFCFLIKLRDIANNLKIMHGQGLNEYMERMAESEVRTMIYHESIPDDWFLPSRDLAPLPPLPLPRHPALRNTARSALCLREGTKTSDLKRYATYGESKAEDSRPLGSAPDADTPPNSNSGFEQRIPAVPIRRISLSPQDFASDKIPDVRRWKVVLPFPKPSGAESSPAHEESPDGVKRSRFEAAKKAAEEAGAKAKKEVMAKGEEEAVKEMQALVLEKREAFERRQAEEANRVRRESLEMNRIVSLALDGDMYQFEAELDTLSPDALDILILALEVPAN